MKRFLSVLLAAAMIFCLCACGATEANTNEKPAESQTQPQTQSNEPANEPAAEPAEATGEQEPAISEAAKNYPSGPITWYAQGAGDASDMAARIIGEKLAEKLGATIVFENVPGAGGMNAANPVYDAEADGLHILGLTVPMLCLTPIINSSCRYTYEDFDPLYCIFEQPQVMVVGANEPYDTFEEWYAYVEEHPGEFIFSTNSISSVFNLCLQHLKVETGLDFDTVAYDSGSEAIAAVLGGHVNGIALGLANLRQYIDSGDVKLICYTSEAKSVLYPDTPTLKELGYSAHSIPFQGIAIKAGTDPDVREILYTALDEVMNDPEVIQQLTDAGCWYEGTCYGSEQFTQAIKNHYDYYKDVLESTGLIDQLSS